MIVSQLHHLLQRAAEATPEAPALTYREDTWSYARLWAEAQRAARLLGGAGVRPGDRVAVYLEKRIETVASIFASSIAGAIVVPVNPVLKPSQVGHIVRDSGARVMVTSTERLGLLVTAPGGDDRPGVETAVVVGSTGGTQVEGCRVHDWSADPSLPADAGGIRLDVDPAAILYTSGSTGRPKGVVVSHRNLLAGAESVSSYLDNTRDDVILSVLPLSFDAGLSQITTAFAVGAHCVLMNYLLPREVPALCERHGVTGLTCVPPLWFQLAAVPWPAAAAARLRYWANTGGRMPRTTLATLRATFPAARPYLMYGLTEAFRSTFLDPEEVDRRPDSIGKAVPHAEVLVLRPDGTRCGPGEEGELVHRGALVTLGYWNDPERTAVRYRPLAREGEPWRCPEMSVWSGDTVVADPDGFLYFVGRRDEMIKTSGYRVSPTEVEEAAHSTGMVRDAAALGVDDAALGQRIVLFVTPAAETLEESALAAALRRVLPRYMLPSRIEVCEQLPRSPNGKFDRVLLRSGAVS